MQRHSTPQININLRLFSKKLAEITEKGGKMNTIRPLEDGSAVTANLTRSLSSQPPFPSSFSNGSLSQQSHLSVSERRVQRTNVQSPQKDFPLRRWSRERHRGVPRPFLPVTGLPRQQLVMQRRMKNCRSRCATGAHPHAAHTQHQHYTWDCFCFKYL